MKMGTKANKHRGRNRYHGRGKKAAAVQESAVAVETPV